MVDYQVPHTYTRGCPQVIAQVRDGDQRAMDLVTLTGCPDEITAVVERDPSDPTGYTALLTWDNAGEGAVSVRWDAGALIPGQPAQGSLAQVFAEGDEGVHTATVTDESDPNRRVVVTFEVPLGAPLDVTISADPSDPTGYTALAIWGPSEGPTPPGELYIIIGSDVSDPTGYTALATWTTEEEGGQP